MARNVRTSRLHSLTLAALAALTLAAAAACAAQTSTVALSASPDLRPRLEALVHALPLPHDLALAPDGNAAAVVSLMAAGDAPPHAGEAIAENAGTRWLVAALPLADARFDLTESEARHVGLVDIESIVPPRRAARVDGRWPGESGYPFAENLVLAARASGGRLPDSLRAWLRDAAALSAAEPAPLRLAAVGDLEVGPGEAGLLSGGAARAGRLFDGALLARLASDNLLIANLEGQITARSEAEPLKRYHFRFTPGTGSTLRALGFGLLLLANNHSLDFGRQGLHDTFADLSAAGLPYVGAGADAHEARALRPALPSGSPNILFVGLGTFPDESLGFRLADAAASTERPGINADLPATLEAIRSAAAAGATVVALVHGGVEFSETPGTATRTLFRRLVDAGAALVIGSHPHVLQGIEARGSALIAYSLGDFLFTGRQMPPSAQASAVLTFLVYKGLVRGVDEYPVLVTPTGTRTDPRPEQARARFAAQCAALAGR